MKVAKIKKQKQEKNEKPVLVENEYSLKKILTTLGIVVVVFVAFYFITTLFVKPTKNEEEKNNTNIEFDSSLITLNHLLDRKDNEYYVLANMNDSDINYNEIYNRYLSKYKLKEGALKVYSVDLSDSFNSRYIGETNITDNLSELKINEDVLFKIKDGRIEEHYVGSTDIGKALSNLTKN